MLNMSAEGLCLFGAHPEENGPSLCRSARHCIALQAEREGFEPPEAQAPHRFSRPAHSATLPPLRVVARDFCYIT
jgi:hypothetical protein